MIKRTMLPSNSQIADSLKTLLASLGCHHTTSQGSSNIRKARFRMLNLALVLQGYAQTARDTRLGRLGEGADLEAAWRRRHKWAAQRVAHLLTDTPASPPLACAADVLGKLSLCIGVGVDGMGLGDTPSGSGAMPRGAITGSGLGAMDGSVGGGWLACGAPRLQIWGSIPVGGGVDGRVGVATGEVAEDAVQAASSLTDQQSVAEALGVLADPPLERLDLGSQREADLGNRQVCADEAKAEPLDEATLAQSAQRRRRKKRKGGNDSGVLDSPSELCGTVAVRGSPKPWDAVQDQGVGTAPPLRINIPNDNGSPATPSGHDTRAATAPEGMGGSDAEVEEIVVPAADVAPLFGQGDHLGDEMPLTVKDRLQLTIR